MYQLFRHVRCRYLLLFLVMQCLTAAAAFAQVKLTGKVTDETGTPLPGITVAIKNTRSGAMTDVDGNFVINADLKPGTYTVSFSGIGFAPKQSDLVICTGRFYTLNT